MPRSTTAPGRPGACNDAPGRIAFHQQNGVGTRIDVAFAVQWLAYTIPCSALESYTPTDVTTARTEIAGEPQLP